MQLHLPPKIINQLIAALSKAGTREIGGILMGEHIAENVFRVRELTIQRRGGTFATFVRAVQDIIGPLRNFFHSMQHDFRRFNYLGEWHSHPSFAPVPSHTDHRTMHDIINDSEVGAHFVVLMVIKLDSASRLLGSVTVYQPSGVQFEGELVEEAKI